MGKNKISSLKFNDGKVHYALPKEDLAKYNASIFNLGNLSVPCEGQKALSVFFDLEGFTNFCNKRDPELDVHLFLTKYLNWILEKIKDEILINDKEIEHEKYHAIYSNLPFHTKFLGDGLWFLWDVEKLEKHLLCNIIISCYNISNKYSDEFLPLIRNNMHNVPQKLRCGAAFGTIYNIGENDFVGPCINISSRLQKFNGLTFCFATKGIDISQFHKEFLKLIIYKKALIRGIGWEIVGMFKKDFDKLKPEDKEVFKKVDAIIDNE